MKDIIQKIINDKGRCVLAIDGRCASGKTTYANKLAEECGGEVIHMDEFFLRREQRTDQRFTTPGENIDHERMMEEVFMPLGEGKPFSYHPFDCEKMEIGEEIYISNKSLIIVEGCYSLREEFRPFYDYSIFCTISKETQIERIKERNPDKLERFINEWIPMEEEYFEAYNVMDYADKVIEMA